MHLGLKHTCVIKITKENCKKIILIGLLLYCSLEFE